MKLTRTVTAAALTGLLTVMISACSSSDGESTPPTSTPNARQTYVLATPTSGRPTASTTAAAAGPTATTAAAVPAAALRYQKIREPFSRPGECNEDGSTLEMTACVLEQVIDVDSTVDALQLKRFEQAKDAKRAGILAEYASWLKGRTTTCAATSGGSIDQVTEAQCLLTASQNRVETLNDVS
jgi:uncharacterized protein YecT (DUF1311 family)